MNKSLADIKAALDYAERMVKRADDAGNIKDRDYWTDKMLEYDKMITESVQLLNEIAE